jgi:hypothetical protein
MSDAQESWLLGELSDNSTDLIVWVSTRPWINKDEVGDDSWGGFAEQRKRIANHIATNNIKNLVMLSGDAHMVAIDNGTNSDYNSVSGNAGFPVFQAAALDRWGSVKGGPFSHGCYTYTAFWSEQYGIMEVYYNEENKTCINWKGYRTISDTETELLVQMDSCVPLVIKGTPGEDTCLGEIMPLMYWLSLCIVYGVGVIAVIFSLSYYCRDRYCVNGFSHRRRIVLISSYLILNFTSLIITFVLLYETRYLPTRPTYFPQDIVWIGLLLTCLFLIYLIVEYCLTRRANKRTKH